MNTGTSPYHAIGALFCRGPRGDLLSIEGRCADLVASHWPELRNLINETPRTCTTLPSGTAVYTTTVSTSKVENLQLCRTSSIHSHTVRELYRLQENHHVGLVSCDTSDDTQETNLFRDWLERHVLLETSLRPSEHEYNSQDIKALRTTEVIASLFADTLKNVASKDEWDTGAELFKRRIRKCIFPINQWYVR
jgi:hypothetical protein